MNNSKRTTFYFLTDSDFCWVVLGCPNRPFKIIESFWLDHVDMDYAQDLCLSTAKSIQPDFEYKVVEQNVRQLVDKVIMGNLAHFGLPHDIPLKAARCECDRMTLLEYLLANHPEMLTND